MGRVILCETKEAKTSYVFPNTKVEVFSYEELCYYIYNNVALIAEEYISAPMFNFIEHELGLADLAEHLKTLKAKDTTDLTDLLTAILAYKEYYSVSEVREFIFRIERMRGLSKAEFRKLQADGFLRYKKFIKAVAIYDELIEKDKEIIVDDLLASIYHNRGVALAGNFELMPACDSFLKAYELNENNESLFHCLLVLSTIKERSEVEALAKFYQADPLIDKIYEAVSDADADVKGAEIYHRMEKAVFHYKKNNLTDFSKSMEKVVEELKTEFREQTV